MKTLSFIFASGRRGEFGCTGTPNHLPFYNKYDLKYFKQMTLHSIIIAGYYTGSVLPILKNRRLLIIDHGQSDNNFRETKKDIIYVPSIYFAIKKAEQLIDYNPTLNKNIFVIGGKKLFNTIKMNPYLFSKVEYVYHNIIANDCMDAWLKKHEVIKGSITYFNYEQVVKHFNLLRTTPLSSKVLNHVYYRNPQEMQYINLLKDVLLFGEYTNNRTSTPTYVLLNKKLTFSLEDQFPLFTHRKMFLRGIFEELKWFLGGQTNANILKKKKVKIWTKNSTRAFLDQRGLTENKEGDCGPIYGFQWRHFGEKYVDCDTEYKGGFDQIGYVISQLKQSIKSGKFSRRIVLSGWNPPDLQKMALPPCHILYMWNIYKKKLCGTLVMRSGDLVLGVPFNVASMSILTRLIAKEVGLECGTITLFIANAHIYQNHVENLTKLFSSKVITHPFPKLELSEQISILRPSDMMYNDLILKNYKSCSRIKFSMVA